MAIRPYIQISLEVETIKAMKSTDDKSLCIRDDGMKPFEGLQPLFPAITNDYTFMLVAELTKAVVDFESVGFDFLGRNDVPGNEPVSCFPVQAFNHFHLYKAWLAVFFERDGHDHGSFLGTPASFFAPSVQCRRNRRRRF